MQVPSRTKIIKLKRYKKQQNDTLVYLFLKYTWLKTENRTLSQMLTRNLK